MNSHFHTKLYLYEANRNIIVHDDNDILQETLSNFNSLANHQWKYANVTVTLYVIRT